VVDFNLAFLSVHLRM